MAMYTVRNEDTFLLPSAEQQERDMYFAVGNLIIERMNQLDALQDEDNAAHAEEYHALHTYMHTVLLPALDATEPKPSEREEFPLGIHF